MNTGTNTPESTALAFFQAWRMRDWSKCLRFAQSSTLWPGHTYRAVRGILGSRSPELVTILGRHPLDETAARFFAQGKCVDLRVAVTWSEKAATGKRVRSEQTVLVRIIDEGEDTPRWAVNPTSLTRVYTESDNA